MKKEVKAPRAAARNGRKGLSDERRAEIGQARRARTYKTLLDAAARHLAERGEKAFSIEGVITEAAVSRGTFYNYFVSREDLIEQLWQYAGHDPFSAILRAQSEVTDQAERISMFARHSIYRAAQDHTWGWLVVYIAESEQILNHELITYPLPDLEAGIAAGRFRPGILPAARDLVVGATIAAIRSVLNAQLVEGYCEQLVALILQALGLKPDDAEVIANQPLTQLQP